MSAPVALAAAFILFAALAILALGVLTFVTGREIIAVPGLGQAPGVWGMLAALAAFAGTLWTTLRPLRPSYGQVGITALATPLAHLFVVWLIVLASDAGLVAATTVAGNLVRGGASVVLLLVAGVAAWSGVALRRTRARSPHWPWEREDDDEDA